MDNLFAEIEYIKNHFPELVLQYMPPILIVVTICHVLLLLIHHSRKSDGTETGKKTSDALMGMIVTGWILLIVLISVYAYFYYVVNYAK